MMFTETDLERLTGYPRHRFKDMSYAMTKGDYSRRVSRLNEGHRFVRGIAQPMLCAACVETNGYISRSWDNSLVTACPIHAVRGLNVCGTCCAPLNWERKRLARCDCDARFADQASERASFEELALSEVMVRAETGLHGPGYPELLGYPTVLHHTTVDNAVFFIQSLGRLGHIAKTRGAVRAMSLFERIQPGFKLLEHWPARLDEWFGHALDSVGLAQVTGKIFSQAGSVIPKRVGNRTHRETRALLSNQLVCSIQQHTVWVPHLRSVRRLTLEQRGGCVTYAQFLELTNLTALEFQFAAVEHPLQTHAEGNRMYVRVPDDYKDLEHRYRVLGIEAIADRLDVPLSVAKGIVDAGLINAIDKCSRGRVLEREFAAFEKRLRAFAESSHLRATSQDCAGTTVGRLLRDRRIPAMSRVTLLERILTGEVQVLKRADAFSSIVVAQPIVTDWRTRHIHADGPDGWVMTAEAADYLDIFQNAVISLIAAGELECEGKHMQGRKIRLASLKSFQSRYVSTRTVANLAGVATNTVLGYVRRAYGPAAIARPGAFGFVIRRDAIPDLTTLACEIASAPRMASGRLAGQTRPEQQRISISARR